MPRASQVNSSHYTLLFHALTKRFTSRASILPSIVVFLLLVPLAKSTHTPLIIEVLRLLFSIRLVLFKYSFCSLRNYIFNISVVFRPRLFSLPLSAGTYFIRAINLNPELPDRITRKTLKPEIMKRWVVYI